MCSSSDLLALLSSLLAAGEGIPLQVTVKTDDEVLRLRQEVADLRVDLDKLQQDFTRVEYHYRCESVINTELVDLCRKHGIKIRPSLFKRPY